MSAPKSNLERLEYCEYEITALRDELAYCRRALDMQTPLVAIGLRVIAEDEQAKRETNKRLGIA